MPNNKKEKGDKKIGNQVKRFRKKRGMSQMQLAELSMVSSSCITRLERGETMVSIFTLLQIAEALDVGIEDILEPYTRNVNCCSDLIDLGKKLDAFSNSVRIRLIQNFENILDCMTDKNE